MLCTAVYDKKSLLVLKKLKKKYIFTTIFKLFSGNKK